MTRSTLDTGWTNSHENEPENGIVSSLVAEEFCGSTSFRGNICVRGAARMRTAPMSSPEYKHGKAHMEAIPQGNMRWPERNPWTIP